MPTLNNFFRNTSHPVKYRLLRSEQKKVQTSRVQVVDEGNFNFPTTTELHQTRVLVAAVSARRRLKIIPREKVKDAAQFSVTE